MKAIITGATGFVGTKLADFLFDLGYDIEAITRDVLKNQDKLVEMIDSADVVINLAGAPIIKYWSDEYKKVLYSSRIDTTKELVFAMKKAKNRPKLFISTSAVGVYKNDKVYDETTTDYENDLLANICKDWEKEALNAKDFGVRVAIFRFGIVLGKNGGALAKMITPFKFGLGGTIGDGSQKFSFIHIDDLLNSYKFIIEHEELNGVFNLTAPTPTTNLELTKTLGRYLNRPTILSVPLFVLKLIFGDGAKVLTDGQSVIPKRLIDNGFVFKYNNIDECVKSLL